MAYRIMGRSAPCGWCPTGSRPLAPQPWMLIPAQLFNLPGESGLQTRCALPAPCAPGQSPAGRQRAPPGFHAGRRSASRQHDQPQPPLARWGRVSTARMSVRKVAKLFLETAAAQIHRALIVAGGDGLGNRASVLDALHQRTCVIRL